MVVEVCALAIIAALSFFLLSELKWRGAPVLAVLCFVGVLSMAGRYAEERGRVGSLISGFAGAESVSAILKIIGVGYLAGISADICAELGASRIGSAVALIGRLEIIAIAAPFFVKMIDMGVEVIG